MKTRIHYTEDGMKLISISYVTPFDQTDARKFLFVYLEKVTDKSSFTDLINKRLETIADDRKLPYLEQVEIHSEKAQRENRGLTATQTQWFEDYLRDFKAKRQPSEQAMPSTVQADSDTKTEQSRIDEEALRALFLPVFFADDYKQRETLNETKKMSRFDIFVERLESLLNDTHCTQKQIGNVAYMIHKSKLTAIKYRRKGKFAETLRFLFQCCQRKEPKDQGTTTYNKPDKDLEQAFSELLGNPTL